MPEHTPAYKMHKKIQKVRIVFITKMTAVLEYMPLKADRRFSFFSVLNLNEYSIYPPYMASKWLVFAVYL